MSPEQDAPKPATVVGQFRPGRSQPQPIDALRSEDPQRLTFLLPFRAGGALKEALDAHPDTSRATLERMLVVTHSQDSDIRRALDAFKADRHVRRALIVPPDHYTFHSGSNVYVKFEPEQRFPNLLNVAADVEGELQRTIPPGFGDVALVDTGIDTGHPALQSVTAGRAFVGGNFIGALSLDFHLTEDPTIPITEPNVDELEPVPTTDPDCDTFGGSPADGVMVASNAGHGTHTAGLVVARPTSENNVEGVCETCSVGVFRVAENTCEDGETPFASLNSSAVPAAITIAADFPFQVINTSFGSKYAFEYHGQKSGESGRRSRAHLFDGTKSDLERKYQ